MQGIIRGGTLGSEGRGDFTKQKRGLCEQRQDDEGGNLECVRRALRVVRAGVAQHRYWRREEAEDMNQVSLQICLLRQAPHKHLLSEW